MNGMGMYHMDVKGANILVGQDNKCRLIDWGLTQIQSGDEVPKDMRNKPIHYNLPFGVVMFSDDIRRIIENVRRTYNIRAGGSTFEQIMNMTYFKPSILVSLASNGHYRYIQDSIYPTFTRAGGWGAGISGPKFEDLMISHIAKIAEKYTHNGRQSFNEKEYFNDVFKHNCDVWGLIMAYVDLYSNEPREFKNSSMKRTRDMFYEYLNIIFFTNIFSLEYTVKKYDINIIIEMFKELSESTGHPIGRLTPVSSSPVIISPPSPPSPKVPTPPPTPPAVVAPVAAPVAVTLCDAAKQSLCRAKGKVCNPSTGRCIIEKIPKGKKKASSPKPVVVTAPVVAAPATLCSAQKIALCNAKGKVCNEATGRCIINKPGKSKTKKISAKKSTPKSSKRKSSSGVSLGTRKRCPRGYRLNTKKKKCKKIHKGGDPSTFNMSRLQHLFITKDNYSENKSIIDEELRKLTSNQDADSDVIANAIYDYKDELSISRERENDIGPSLLLLKYNAEIVGYVFGYVNLTPRLTSDSDSE